MDVPRLPRSRIDVSNCRPQVSAVPEGRCDCRRRFCFLDCCAVFRRHYAISPTGSFNKATLLLSPGAILGSLLFLISHRAGEACRLEARQSPLFLPPALGPSQSSRVNLMRVRMVPRLLRCPNSIVSDTGGSVSPFSHTCRCRWRHSCCSLSA